MFRIIFIHLPFLYNVRDLNSFASLNVPTYISYIYTFRKSGIILKTFQHLAFKSTVFRNISLGRKKEEAYPSYDSPRNFRSNVLFPTRSNLPLIEIPRIEISRFGSRSKFSPSLVTFICCEQDFSIMARDKRRKVSSAEIKFSDESVTTIQFRPRKKNARRARSWRNARWKSFSRNAVQRLTIGKETFGLRSRNLIENSYRTLRDSRSQNSSN